VEETIRGNPIDGVVLLVGCDKTTPALLMGAASCDLPSIAVSGGPMLSGSFRGTRIGSGTDLYRFSEEVRAGRMSLADFKSAESAMSRSPGSCNTMGTASADQCGDPGRGFPALCPGPYGGAADRRDGA
jgi:dihydroxy-acid dehydratase